ncbi:putative oxidoreductase [Roseovarius sp. MBR-154]
MTASPNFALFLVRISFGAFILLWGLSKVMRPDGAERLFATYYGIDGLGHLLAIGLGSLQALVGLAILLRLARTFSYGVGVLIHGTSTIATMPHLIMPLAEGSNLLFWSGVPILLAAIGLFLARCKDTLLSLDTYRNEDGSRLARG